MFQGLRTVIYRVADLQDAKQWYIKFLGKEPYFDEPFYVGFNVGGYEVGLHPCTEDLSTGNNVEVYLGVDEITSSLNRALELGATLNTDVQDVGGNIKVATVLDPYGNIVGLIENPNFKIE